jgi:hypothetical protein
MIHLSNRFITKIKTDKSNESILLELSMPTYDTHVEINYLRDPILPPSVVILSLPALPNQWV